MLLVGDKHLGNGLKPAQVFVLFQIRFFSAQSLNISPSPRVKAKGQTGKNQERKMKGYSIRKENGTGETQGKRGKLEGYLKQFASY